MKSFAILAALVSVVVSHPVLEVRQDINVTTTVDNPPTTTDASSSIGTTSTPTPTSDSTPAPSGPPTDTDILNFALTLEHLESAFYSGALSNYTQDDFVKAGLPSWSRGRFEQIGQHENMHVEFLSGVLGADATQPCQYDFPYTDPKSFAALASVLEGVGVSAYAGAAQFISNKEYLTAAAVVLSTESRHSSWVAAAVNKHAAWSGAFDTPLGLNEVYSLAAQFIVNGSCPTTNPVLPVKAFPVITINEENPQPGDTIVVSYEGVNSTSAPPPTPTGDATSTIPDPIPSGATTVNTESPTTTETATSTVTDDGSVTDAAPAPTDVVTDSQDQGLESRQDDSGAEPISEPDSTEPAPLTEAPTVPSTSDESVPTTTESSTPEPTNQLPCTACFIPASPKSSSQFSMAKLPFHPT